MKILHIFDHSLPLHSGYTFRSRAILQQQRKLGYQTCHVTSPKHPTKEQGTEQAEGFSFYRTLPYRLVLALTGVKRAGRGTGAEKAYFADY